ncbi:PrsW family glutamic-type intramembrane protease [Bacteroidia bacterium]|nr:PrsW family glutamic-type intramembrane protease [Bacteroidia bacterium]
MLLLGIAIAPVIVIIWYFLFLDKLNKEPLKMLIRTFLFGVLSVVPAVLMSLLGTKLLGPVNNVPRALFEAFIVVALAEELAKYFFLRKYVFKRVEFEEPYDGIVYAVMISMGFAAIENVMYVMQGGFAVGVMRMFTAVPAHATFAVLMGYWVGRAKMENKPYLNWLGLGSAVLFHGLYDVFLLSEYVPGQLIGALISLVVGIVFARSAVRIHRTYFV